APKAHNNTTECKVDRKVYEKHLSPPWNRFSFSGTEKNFTKMFLLPEEEEEEEEGEEEEKKWKI
ncbi:hypothetical protein RUM43_008728, partial [Polyplax serrata]